MSREPRFDISNLEQDDETQGAAPGSGLFGVDCPIGDAQVAIVPAPFEATVSYRPGTAGGPAAVLEASHQVELFDLHVGTPYRAGVTMATPRGDIAGLSREGRRLAEPIVSAGGVASGDASLEHAASRVDEICSQVNQVIFHAVSEQLSAGRIPGVLGGEHGVAFGAIAAVARQWPGIGILQVDAHADLRKAYEGLTWSHASVMQNVLTRVPDVARLVQVGVRDLCASEYQRITSDPRIATWFAPWIQARKREGRAWSSLIEAMVAPLPERVYVSFDIDGLDPSLCPNTGTPVPGGLTWDEAVSLLHAVVASGRTLVGFDLTEVAAGGSGHGWDAIVGARLLYKLIGFSLISQGRSVPGVLY